MAKIKIIALLALICAASCGKDKNPVTLTGTQWGTTIRQLDAPNVEILLSFTNDVNGVLTLTIQGEAPETIELTYDYQKPNLVLRPKEGAPYGITRIETKVQGNVIDFSPFAEAWLGYPVEIVLTKKK